MSKELKRNVLIEEKKGSILALRVEGYNEHQVASILKISAMAHKNKAKRQTLGEKRLKTSKG